MYTAAVGALIGASQVMIGHPIDTAKVLAQNNKSVILPKVSHYYRGCLYPLMCSTTVNSIMFPTYTHINTYTHNHHVSGCLAGLAISPLLFGFDYFKIRRQNNIKNMAFQSAKGFPLLTTRECIAMGLYFGNYEIFKEYVDNGVAGGMSGILSWSLTYPLDVIVSRQISQQVSVAEALSQGRLTAGLGYCLLRALLVNSVSFKLYATLAG